VGVDAARVVDAFAHDGEVSTVSRPGRQVAVEGLALLGHEIGHAGEAGFSGAVAGWV